MNALKQAAKSPSKSVDLRGLSGYDCMMHSFCLGLRTEHYTDILDTHPSIDWFEILSENYLVPGGKPLYYLDKIRERYPMVLHGVSMSIGSLDPLNWDY